MFVYGTSPFLSTIPSSTSTLGDPPHASPTHPSHKARKGAHMGGSGKTLSMHWGMMLFVVFLVVFSSGVTIAGAQNVSGVSEQVGSISTDVHDVGSNKSGWSFNSFSNAVGSWVWSGGKAASAVEVEVMVTGAETDASEVDDGSEVEFAEVWQTSTKEILETTWSKLIVVDVTEETKAVNPFWGSALVSGLFTGTGDDEIDQQDLSPIARFHRFVRFFSRLLFCNSERDPKKLYEFLASVGTGSGGGDYAQDAGFALIASLKSWFEIGDFDTQQIEYRLTSADANSSALCSTSSFHNRTWLPTGDLDGWTETGVLGWEYVGQMWAIGMLPGNLKDGFSWTEGTSGHLYLPINLNPLQHFLLWTWTSGMEKDFVWTEEEMMEVMVMLEYFGTGIYGQVYKGFYLGAVDGNRLTSSNFLEALRLNPSSTPITLSTFNPVNLLVYLPGWNTDQHLLGDLSDLFICLRRHLDSFLGIFVSSEEFYTALCVWYQMVLVFVGGLFEAYAAGLERARRARRARKMGWMLRESFVILRWRPHTPAKETSTGSGFGSPPPPPPPLSSSPATPSPSTATPPPTTSSPATPPPPPPPKVRRARRNPYCGPGRSSLPPVVNFAPPPPPPTRKSRILGIRHTPLVAVPTPSVPTISEPVAADEMDTIVVTVMAAMMAGWRGTGDGFFVGEYEYGVEPLEVGWVLGFEGGVVDEIMEDLAVAFGGWTLHDEVDDLAMALGGLRLTDVDQGGYDADSSIDLLVQSMSMWSLTIKSVDNDKQDDPVLPTRIPLPPSPIISAEDVPLPDSPELNPLDISLPPSPIIDPAQVALPDEEDDFLLGPEIVNEAEAIVVVPQQPPSALVGNRAVPASTSTGELVEFWEGVGRKGATSVAPTKPVLPLRPSRGAVQADAGAGLISRFTTLQRAASRGGRGGLTARSATPAPARDGRRTPRATGSMASDCLPTGPSPSKTKETGVWVSNRGLSQADRKVLDAWPGKNKSQANKDQAGAQRGGGGGAAGGV